MLGRVSEGPEAVEGKTEEPLAQKDDLLWARQDPEVGIQARVEGRVAQDLVPKSVERPDPRLRVSVGDQLVHPLGHLDRRLLGECEGEDLLGAGPLRGDEVGDPPGEDGRLPGSGSGDDEEWASLVEHGFALGRRKALEDPLLDRGR